MNTEHVAADIAELVPIRPVAVREPGFLPTIFDRFLREKAARGLARNTLLAYGRDLSQFLGYCQQRDVQFAQHVTAGIVADFVTALVDGEGCSPRTAARKLEAVRGALEFAHVRGIIPRNPANAVDPPRWQARPPNAPPLTVLLRLVESIATDDATGIRDRAAMRVLLDAGLRIAALCELDLYDERQPPACTVRPDGVVTYRAKGGAIREAVIGEGTRAAIDAWLAVRPQFLRDREEPALFLSSRGARLSRATLHARIKHYGRQAGMPHLHAHLFRHARARDVIERSGLASATALLGHARQSITADLYAEYNAEVLRRRIREEASLDALAGRRG